MYNYFIVYYFNSNGRQGVGNCNCERDMKITNIEDIREIEDTIKEHQNFKETRILNYILLSEEKENA